MGGHIQPIRRLYSPCEIAISITYDIRQSLVFNPYDIDTGHIQPIRKVCISDDLDTACEALRYFRVEPYLCQEYRVMIIWVIGFSHCLSILVTLCLSLVSAASRQTWTIRLADGETRQVAFHGETGRYPCDRQVAYQGETGRYPCDQQVSYQGETSV